MLADLQRDFRSWITTASSDTVQRMGVSAMAGLSVYQNNFRAQLVGCLEESFPQLRTWLGEEVFLHAAITHINGHPPHAWTLDAYASGFNETLHVLFPDNPDIQELAWIENALAEAFVAPDAEPLPPEVLSAVDWDCARISLTPSFISRIATTNAEPIWSAMRDQSTPPESEMLAEPCGLIVWRRGYATWLKQVDLLEYTALHQLRDDGSFTKLCDMLVDRLGDEHGVARAGTLLAGWLSSELVVNIE
ncbi:HvfC/BufC family peptide modification chaperone [Paraburkholderia fungorum]|uniref:HvfC/BufC family peptide modification chaperone n=1 Tax=Paraburkholderia fungorum TaxID=134537 RepID=UPI0038BD82C2